MHKRSLVLLSFSLLSLAAGCKAATDANTPCFLVAGTDDGGRKGLTEVDLTTLGGTNHDFISFGSVECDDQICVRDSKFLADAGIVLGTQTPCTDDSQCTAKGEICSAEEVQLSGGTQKGHVCSSAAPGYCSHACIAGQTCASQNSDLDQSSATRLTCRSLLLDPDTLAEICSSDGGTNDCVTKFGGNSSPFFCARGQTPDGGS